MRCSLVPWIKVAHGPFCLVLRIPSIFSVDIQCYYIFIAIDCGRGRHIVVVFRNKRIIKISSTLKNILLIVTKTVFELCY